MNKIKQFWKQSKFITILTLIQFGVAILLIILMILVNSLELKIATGGFILALVSTAASDLNRISDIDKTQQILTKLEVIQKQIERPYTMVDLIGKSLDIIDNVTQRNLGRHQQ